GWNNQINAGQYIWDVINPNPSKWKEGVRLMHHVLQLNGKNQEVVKRACGTLGHLYADCLEDYARAAFWWRLAGDNDLNLAHCYWKLGSKPMAEAILKQYSNDNTRHGTLMRLWAEMGETDTALTMATKRAGGSTPDVGHLVAGDIHRLTGQYPEALKSYQKVLDVKTGSRDLVQTQKRARSNIEAIKVFDSLDLKRIPDGKYKDKALGYEADVEVEVSVKSGKIDAVRVTQHREKQYYSALADTTRQIIDKQAVKGVDATARATITSEAIINATAKALASGLK
ncbi:MAG: FMN-binding domain protein, partial [Planctomycetaceae bacterium]|nr:FMN-binding domain protein [Planctomycetaceae bacterium]